MATSSALKNRLHRVAWVALPAAIVVGDIYYRWPAILPPRIFQPSNYLLSLGMSVLFWWATSRVVTLLPGRRWWVGAIAALSAAMLTAGWQMARFAHFPDAAVTRYLFHEPRNALALARHGLQPGAIILFAALAATWFVALQAYTPPDPAPQNPRERLYWFATLGASALIAMLSPPATALTGSPYGADFHLARELGQATMNALANKEQVIGFYQRDLQLEPAPPAERPNIVVFIHESLRRDHMGLWGYARQTTPRLAQFARTAPGTVVKFERAWANSAFTPLSVSTMTNGQYLSRSRAQVHQAPFLWHYARHVGAQSALLSPQDWQWWDMEAFFLRNEPPDQVFTARDFNAPIANDMGIDDRVVAEKAVEVLKNFPPGQPFLAVIQANATHFPFLTDDRVSWPLTTPEDRYDAATYLADAYFGEVIDALAATGQLANTVILMTSDHGEFIRGTPGSPGNKLDPTNQEGGRLRFESCHPYIAQIPMLLYVPDAWMHRLGLQPQQLQANAQRVSANIDILPTVLDLWGLQPAGPIDGYSLLRPVPDERHTECYIRPSWSMSYTSGVNILTRDQAIYLRADFNHAVRFDVQDAAAHMEYQGGERLRAEDLSTLAKIRESDELLDRYIDTLLEYSPALLDAAR